MLGGRWCLQEIRARSVISLCYMMYIALISVRQLKKAKKDGRLAEALLERRAKLKRCVSIFEGCLHDSRPLQRPFLLIAIAAVYKYV